MKSTCRGLDRKTRKNAQAEHRRSDQRTPLCVSGEKSRRPKRESRKDANMSKKPIGVKVAALKPKLQFGGRTPSEDLRPADYLVRCLSAWTRPRGKETQAVWQFQ